MNDPLQVVVAVVQRADGRVLVAHRDAARHQGGRLEFPGGKIEPGEPTEAALARELDEELGIRVTRSEPLIRVRHRYPDRFVELVTRRVTGWSGEPRGVEGQALEWRQPDVLSHWSFPAANRPIVATLTLPALSLVTPPLEATTDTELRSLLDSVGSAIARQPMLVRFRAPRMQRAQWQDWLHALAEVVGARAGSRLVVNAPVEWSDGLPEGVGIHLAAAEAARLAERPVAKSRLFSCACHDADEIHQAERLDADIGYLGSVRATPTHPGGPTLGWAGVERLSAQTDLPLYVIGGLTAEDLERARDAGAVGVAAIRAFVTLTRT